MKAVLLQKKYIYIAEFNNLLTFIDLDFYMFPIGPSNNYPQFAYKWQMPKMVISHIIQNCQANDIIWPLPFNMHFKFIYNVENLTRSFKIKIIYIMPKWHFSHLVAICQNQQKFLYLLIDIRILLMFTHFCHQFCHKVH